MKKNIVNFLILTFLSFLQVRFNIFVFPIIIGYFLIYTHNMVVNKDKELPNFFKNFLDSVFVGVKFSIGLYIGVFCTMSVCVIPLAPLAYGAGGLSTFATWGIYSLFLEIYFIYALPLVYKFITNLKFHSIFRWEERLKGKRKFNILILLAIFLTVTTFLADFYEHTQHKTESLSSFHVLSTIIFTIFIPIALFLLSKLFAKNLLENGENILMDTQEENQSKATIKFLVCIIYVIIIVAITYITCVKKYGNPFMHCKYTKGYISAIKPDFNDLAANQGKIFCRYKNKNLYYEAANNPKIFYKKEFTLHNEYLKTCGIDCDFDGKNCKVGICNISECPTGYNQIRVANKYANKHIHNYIEYNLNYLGVCYDSKYKKVYPKDYNVDETYYKDSFIPE